MSLVFLNVNTDTYAVNYASYGNPNHLAYHNAFITLVDDTDIGVKDLLLNPSSHSFLDVIGNKPYLSAYYDGNNVVFKLNNSVSVPNQASLSILGSIHQVPIISNQATIAITVHPAVQIQRITVTAIIEGFPYSAVEIGGTGSSVEAQVYKDSNGTLQVVPAKSSDLANYWQNALVDMSYSDVDLATADGIAIHTLFKYVLPALSLTLTENEQASLVEIQNNLLPSITTNLTNILDGSNLDIHYNSYKIHTQQAKTAMENYVSDRMEISKYITLK